MNLADERLRELDNASLTPDERALLRSEVAADLTHKGQYGAAREAPGELWRGVGERPNVEGLEGRLAAEVLLQAGVLSGRLGASKQVVGAQDAAKDLISESAALFDENVSHTLRVGFHNELARVLRRLGAAEHRQDYYDRAIIEYTAAIFHAEKA